MTYLLCLYPQHRSFLSGVDVIEENQWKCYQILRKLLWEMDETTQEMPFMSIFRSISDISQIKIAKYKA